MFCNHRELDIIKIIQIDRMFSIITSNIKENLTRFRKMVISRQNRYYCCLQSSVIVRITYKFKVVGKNTHIKNIFVCKRKAIKQLLHSIRVNTCIIYNLHYIHINFTMIFYLIAPKYKKYSSIKQSINITKVFKNMMA